MPPAKFEHMAIDDVTHLSPPPTFGFNGFSDIDMMDVPLEELEKEMPLVTEEQVPLGGLLSRVVQAIYAELSELAETMPNMSDTARKRTLADWVVKTKKQVAKLYAVVKWSRDADAIQKSMNIIAFLLAQSLQFDNAVRSLAQSKENLDQARSRNHDLLTSLDVLTTGSYLRLPSCIKKVSTTITPLTDAEVVKTLSDVENSMRYRLRMSEILPIEMSQYEIYDGRVHFTVPRLFKASLCLRGRVKTEQSGWFFVDVEFLINVAGDLTGVEDFPRVPTGIIKRQIADEADARLGFYLPLPDDHPPLPPDAPPRPQLSPGVVDAPLVRVYNFLQMMSLSYQLEILLYQAERLRSLGWADYLSIQVPPNRKSMKVSYWLRRPPPTIQGRSAPKIPLSAGSITISIVETKAPAQTGPGPARSAKDRALARLQKKSKLGTQQASDEVEGFKFSVTWEPTNGALGINISPEEYYLPEEMLRVNPDNLDFEAILRGAINHHARAILSACARQMQSDYKVFSQPGVVSLIPEGTECAVRVHLCAEEVVIVTLDPRTGRFNLRNVGDLSAAGRSPQFVNLSDILNANPHLLLELFFNLRVSTIMDLAHQKARYLGLRCDRNKNIKAEEYHKLGTDVRGTLFINLTRFPDNYLVLIVTDERFKFALIKTELVRVSLFPEMVLGDIAWVDYKRIREHSLGGTIPELASASAEQSFFEGFNLDMQGLRELYNYCWCVGSLVVVSSFTDMSSARVSYLNVEAQFKLRGIPFTHVLPSQDLATHPELAYLQSSLARSVPALCVQSSDILSGAPAAEAAMPNIRVIPLNWWSNRKSQVVTCVKLKYVQQPVGKKASGRTIIRPSKSIIYDTKEAIVYFLSDNVDKCVDEFLEEWAKVSKMVVIAREVAQMAKQKQWNGVRLLSFDLQTVEFAYSKDYAVSITCQDQLSPTGGNFELQFSRAQRSEMMQTDDVGEVYNPHVKAEPFLREILRQGHGRLMPSLHRLVQLLRDTLPIVVELHAIQTESARNGRNLEILAKNAGWYRLLYGDLRQGLDFRLIRDQGIVVVDASHSLYGGVPAPKSPSIVNNFALRPIPGMKEIVAKAVQEGLAARTLEPGKVAAIDVGVVCNAAGVGPLTRAIHSMVMARLGIQGTT